MEGLDNRIGEISEMLEQYSKNSHRDALKSASVLKRKLSTLREKHLLKAKAFQASATDRKEISKNIEPGSVDLVFTDVPYGQHSDWHNASPNPLGAMLDALLGILSPSSMVAIASDKRQKAAHERYQRLEQFQVGKRRIVLLKPI
jgi:16S rRNA G966 N2-methylase RsmD